ncbi:MAG: ATP-binding protein [Planctomycetes bacterium]|nr:ATP-binding protein [Planctomycetota bacterium]
MARRLTFPPKPGVIRQLRAQVRKVAVLFGAEERIGDNLALVVDELVNNAIEHGVGYRSAGLDLAVQIAEAGERLRIEFFDPEMPSKTVDEMAFLLAQSANGMPSLESERGRGLFLLTVYLQDLAAEPAPNGGLRLVGHIPRK